MVEFLPSKQAVAGSSPVSRSSSLTVALDGPGKPVHGKQAVMAHRDDGFWSHSQASKKYLPLFLARSCLVFQVLTKVFPSQQGHDHLPFPTCDHLFRLRFPDKSVRQLA